MSDEQELREKQIIKNTALWIAALLGPDMTGTECIYAIHQFAKGIGISISQPITWDAINDEDEGVLWRGCCGRTCAAAHTKDEAEALLLAQLKAMNQPVAGPSTIHLGDHPAQE